MTNKKKVLFDDNEEEEEKRFEFKQEKELAINKKYAERYEQWRSKEEMQKLKDKYGDVDESDESSDESEDEDAKELTNDVEIEFFKALSLVKSKDSKIYDKEHCKFFEKMEQQNKEEGDNDTQKKKKETKKDKKPFQLKDLEREMILDKMKKSEKGENIFDEDEEEEKHKKSNKIGYYEEQDEIKKSFKKAFGSDDEEDITSKEDDPGFLKVKSKTKEEKEKEEAEYIEWLKGKRNKLNNPDIEQNMKYLHDYWNDPKLNESERYLRDYILNKRYLDKESEEDDDDDEEEDKAKTTKESKSNETKINHSQPLDYVDLSEEEKIVENQEEFERKYNFRFEDPDPEFIKSYPRTIADSMRREKSKRKEKREEYKKRKELEKLKKKEEIKRLKSLKRKEIQDKIEKLKKVSGLDNIKLTVEDLEKDFDPEEYDKKMQDAVFNDEYYQVNEIANDDNEDDKPVFTDDDEEDLKYMNWDEWKKDDAEEVEEKKEEKPKKEKKKKRKRDEESEEEDPEFEMDCDRLDTKKSLSKKSKLAQALLKKKPLFDESEKTFEEYFDEYYKLDCEDIIGDMPCRFKYREVVPNDFGLTMEEVIKAKDNELNQWASLKKVTAYRSTAEEINDLKLFKNRKNQVDYKKKILASAYNLDEEEAEEDDDQDEDKETEEKPKEITKESSQQDDESKKKKKKSKEKEIENDVSKIDVKHSNDHETSKSNHSKHNKNKKKNKNIMESITDERLLAYGIEPKKFHKKIKYSNNNK